MTQHDVTCDGDSDAAADRETLDLLATPGSLEQIRQAEVDIAAGRAIDANDLRRRLAARQERELGS